MAFCTWVLRPKDETGFLVWGFDLAWQCFGLLGGVGLGTNWRLAFLWTISGEWYSGSGTSRLAAD